MIIDTVNRFARAMDYPGLVKEGQISLVTDISSPGTEFQDKSYGMGSVLDDITSGNFSAIPGSVLTGLTTGDIGAYVVVGALGYLAFAMFAGRSAKNTSRKASRRARLVGSIAQEQALLKAS